MRRMMWLVLLVAVAGCGSEAKKPAPPSADEREVATVVRGYLTAASSALGAGTGEKACGYLTPRAKADLVTLVRDEMDVGVINCSAAVEAIGETTGDDVDKKIGQVKVSSIRVAGSTAQARPTVDGKAGNEVLLRKVAGAWKIDQGLT